MVESSIRPCPGTTDCSFEYRRRARDVLPDVAMLADWLTGFLVGATFDGTYIEYPAGGTSLATPLFTATVALAEQSRGHRFGAANSAFYRAATKGGFNDVLPLATPTAVLFLPNDPGSPIDPGAIYLGTFDYRGPGNSLRTTEGWDPVTGLGTPAGASFIRSLP